MPDNHGMSIDEYEAFEVVTVSFSMPRGYGDMLKQLAETKRTTVKQYLSKHFKDCVVVQELKH